MVKKHKKFLSIFLALLMVITSVFMIQAEGAPFEVRENRNAGARLVADQDTRYITVFEQDPDTKLITATVQIQNGNPSESLVISTICTSIGFTDKVSPYNMVTGESYEGGAVLDGDVDPYGAFLGALNRTSPQYMINNGTGRVIGAKIGASGLDHLLVVAPGETKDIYRYYFMPKNGADLDISMFDYVSNYYAFPRRLSTWIQNDNGLLAANRQGVTSIETYELLGTLAISPEAFKVQVKKVAPVDLSADNDAREVIGYDVDTMEWADSINGTYQSGAPVIGDGSVTVYVRAKGDSDYTQTSPDGVYVDYKKYIPSEAVPVEFGDAFFAANARAEKTSANARPDGTTHAGDTLTYTITVANDGDARSTWANVVVTDELPEGVTFVDGSIQVVGGDYAGGYDEDTRTLTVSLGDIVGGTEIVVTFDVTVDLDAHGKTILNSATVTGNDGDGGGEITVTPSEPAPGREVVEKSDAPGVDPITEGDRVVTGTGVPGATITVTFPNGETETVPVEDDGNGNGVWFVDVPDGVDLEAGQTVEVVQTEDDKDPSDVVEAIVNGRPDVVPVLSKTSENVYRKDGTNHVGDTLEYTISVKNDGEAKSLWKDVVVIDELPAGLDFVEDSVRIDGDLVTYDFTDGVLTVELGDIPGGEERIVTFETLVNEDAYGMTIKNTAIVDGEEVEEPGPGTPIKDKSAAPYINSITEGDKVVTGTGVDGSTIVVSFPGTDETAIVTVVDGEWSVNVPDGVNLMTGDEVTAVQTENDKDPSDPASRIVGGRPSIGDGNAVVTKTSENITKGDDGRTHVGDTIEYTVVAQNDGDPKSLWVGAVMTDTLPVEVTFVPDSVCLNGDEAPYDFTNGTLTVALGDIAGGTQVTVTFQAVVNEKAYGGKTVVNSVEVKGKDGGDDGEDIEIPVDEEGGQEVVDKSPAPVIYEVNEGDRFITGEGVADATIKVTFEGSTQERIVTVDGTGKWSASVPSSVNLVEGNWVRAIQTVDDLDPSDVVETIINAKKDVVPFMEKTSENMTKKDEYTHVGDTIKYTITVRNDGSPKSNWTNVIVTDQLPEGLTLKLSSIAVNNKKPAYSSYDDVERVLSVSIGNLAGGDEAFVTFEVTVNADAYGLDITNSASVTGKNNGGDDIGTETTEDEDRTVMDKSRNPEVNDVTRGDDKVTGTGEPGSTIIVTFPGGTKEETKVNDDRSWSVDVPDGVELENGDPIYVEQIEKDKEKSDEVLVIVQDKDYRAVTGTLFPVFELDSDLGIDVIVELRETFNSPASSGLSTVAIRSTANSMGTFTIENVPFGTYVLYISRPGYLTRAMMVTVSDSDDDIITLLAPGATEDGVFLLIAGAAKEDFMIDAQDLAFINGALNAVFGEDKYLTRYDFNADGIVDASDLAFVLGNLNKTVLDYAGAEDVDFLS